MLLKSLSLAGVCVAALAIPASAHHSHAMYDPTRRITAEGTVKEYLWSNPHVWVSVTVVNENGEPVDWLLESGSPAAMTRGGWTANSMKVGDAITVTFGPLKDGSSGGVLGTIEMANGEIYSSRALENNVNVTDEEVISGNN